MQRKTVVGTRSSLLWLLILIAVILLVGVAVVALVILPQLQTSRTVQARLAEAERHYQAGVTFQNLEDWVAAEGEYQQIITLDASYKDAPDRLATIRAKKREIAATATAEAVAQIGRVQAEASATAQAAPAATQQAIEVHYQKGLGYINLGRGQEAKAELEQVFDLSPNYKDVQQLLARVQAEVVKLTPTNAPLPLTPKAIGTPTPTSPPDVLLSDNFDDGDASGWKVIGSQVKVIDRQYVAIGDPIILTLAGDPTWRNYSFQARVKYLAGGEGFGLAVRASTDGQTLYLFQFLSGDSWQLVRYDGVVLESGPWVRLASGSYNIVPGTWYTVRIDVQGTRITGYVNEAQVMTAEDARYSEGRVGFRVHTSQVFFDNIEVKPLSNP